MNLMIVRCEKNLLIRYLIKRTPFQLVVGLFIMSVLTGCCHSHFNHDLGGGFQLIGMGDDIIFIRSSTFSKGIRRAPKGPATEWTDVVVGPSITLIGQKGSFVYGVVKKITHGDLEKVGTPGYFILDISTGDIIDGMNKSKWASMLRTKGITKPVLHKPCY